MGTEFVQNQLTATQASKSDLEKSMNRWMKMVKYCYCMQAKIKHAHSFYLGIDDFAVMSTSPYEGSECSLLKHLIFFL